MKTETVVDGGDSTQVTYASPKEVVEMLKSGMVIYENLEGSLEIDGDLLIDDMRLLGKVDLLRFANISGSLTFRNVVIDGELCLAMVTIGGELVLDGLTVFGDLNWAELDAPRIVIKKLEVKGQCGFVGDDNYVEDPYHRTLD